MPADMRTSDFVDLALAVSTFLMAVVAWRGVCVAKRHAELARKAFEVGLRMPLRVTEVAENRSPEGVGTVRITFLNEAEVPYLLRTVTAYFKKQVVPFLDTKPAVAVRPGETRTVTGLPFEALPKDGEASYVFVDYSVCPEYLPSYVTDWKATRSPRADEFEHFRQNDLKKSWRE